MFQGSNKQKFIKGIAILLGMILVIALLSMLHRSQSMTLSEYELLNHDLTSEESEEN